MASAGQAQAHSSQPMHFSSPSGHRLSWWWPWNRGAVGCGFSGYSAVSTFLNIWWKVTPKPLTGLRKSSTGDLRAVARGSRIEESAGTFGLPRSAHADPVVVRQIERGDREALWVAGPAGVAGQLAVASFRFGGGLVQFAFQQSAAFFRPGLPDPDDREEQHQNQPGDDVDARAAAVLPPDPDGGDHHDPDQRTGDEDLPAERHELVVPDAGQRATQPDEAEQQ